MRRKLPFEWHELRYPANLITLTRLLLVPFILRALRQPGQRRRALVLLGIALGSDIIDGPIARHRGEVSNIGKIVDPVADKLLLNGTAWVLAGDGHFPRWVAYLLMVRDLAILLGSSLIYRQRDEIKMAQPLGKASTVAFGAAFLAYLIDGRRAGKPALVVALIAMIGSVLQYLLTFLRAFRQR